MKNSLKQLLRTPMKAILFFFLMALCALLLVFGAGLLVQTNERIDAAESEFKTVGFVEQKPIGNSQELVYTACSDFMHYYSVQEFDEILPVEMLNFEGANYLIEPESRTYYLSYMSDVFNTNVDSYGRSWGDVYIIEFTPLKDCISTEPVDIHVDRVLYNGELADGYRLPIVEEGLEISVCSHYSKETMQFEAGKRYIATIIGDVYTLVTEGRKPEFAFMAAPYSTQYHQDGNPFDSGKIDMSKVFYKENGIWRYFPTEHWQYPGFGVPIYAEEVTEDFYKDGGRGQLWERWVLMHEQYEHKFSVLSTNSLELLPSFHEKQVILKSGREITPEEFKAGARVCMMPEDLVLRNGLEIGDKIKIPLNLSLYGDYQSMNMFDSYYRVYSPLTADGEIYEPFWEAEYELVGIYTPMEGRLVDHPDFDIWMFIIPSKSVGASDENNIAHYAPMNAVTTSFQIPNGTIEAFDRALRKAVPEVEKLNITYDDNGYTDVVSSLNNARMTAVLLLAVGVIAALAIVMLLLYFFIVKQQKRTAIERSLGMSKKQCRVSLLAGLLVLTLIAAVLGSACGAVILSKSDSAVTTSESVDTAGYDTTYSVWAKNANMRNGITLEASVPVAVYVAIPVALTAFVLVLALVLIERNLKIEPILLLSGKME